MALGFRGGGNVSWLGRPLQKPVGRTVVGPWGEVLEEHPDAAVVTDLELRAALEQSGMPWRVKDKEDPE